MVKKSNKESKIFSFSDKDFSKENFLEGAIIRPAIMIVSFFSFIGALFLLILGNILWGGSLIVFSFVLNLDSIYKSLLDESSIYRTMNLFFKLALFVVEIIAFNYVLLI